MATLQAPPTWEAMLLDWAYTALDTRTTERLHALSDTHSERLRAAYDLCEAVTRYHSRTFYAASGLLPEEKRRAVRALYAFCRVTDNLVDQAGTVERRRAALNSWRALSLNGDTSSIGEGGLCWWAIPTELNGEMPDPELVALAWADARARFQIPVGYAEQLIDGVARDLDQTRYATFDDLAAYSYGVASTVGLMAMHIIGFAGEQALPYAVKLGVALQMTNILRDVAEDWHAGRVYLPQEELDLYGLCEADVERMANGAAPDTRWNAFMRFQIERNRSLYAEGTQGIALLDHKGRFAIAAAAELYCAILRDIERHRYDVFSRRAHVSTVGKMRRLPVIWWKSTRMGVAGG